MPKAVLELIVQSVASTYFILTVCIMTAGMMLFQYVSHYSKQSVFKNTVKILNQHFYMEKDWKVLDMDYELLSSPEGRVKTEKAHYAINRNIFVNMASFYPNVTDFVKNLAGLGTFSAILFTLHPVIILILAVSYIADALVSFYVQKWEHKMKDTRTKANNKLYYILDEIKGLSYIFISHRLSSTRFCDRIIYLENGGIGEEGSHEELMAKNGKYKEVYQIQSHYYREDKGEI